MDKARGIGLPPSSDPAGRGTTAIADTATGDAASTDAVDGVTVAASAASMDAATMGGEDTTAVDAAITAEARVADMPRLERRRLRRCGFSGGFPRWWRWIPRWRCPWRRTPIIDAQTCGERDEPGWLPTRPAASWRRYFVLVSSLRTPRRSSAFSALQGLFLPRVNQKAGVPADVRNRQKAPVRRPSPTFVGC
jgi:hypothetical protein